MHSDHTVGLLLLSSANRKSYVPRRLVQQRMALSDLECLKSTSSASRAVSAVAELFVLFSLNHFEVYSLPST